jgi:structure-specific recognition protein 1
LDLGADVDAGVASMQAKGEIDEDSEEDEDFAMNEDEDDGGEPSDMSDDEEGGSDVEAETKPGKPKKQKAPDSSEPKPKKQKKEKKEKAIASPEGEDGKKPRKKRAKKDKNAPKKGMSAFMLFSQDKREQVKTDNPGIVFTDVAKKLGELWKGMGAEDKKPYEARAAEDKQRYQAAMEKYNAAKAAEEGGFEAGSGGHSGAAADTEADAAAAMSD